MSITFIPHFDMNHAKKNMKMVTSHNIMVQIYTKCI